MKVMVFIQTGVDKLLHVVIIWEGKVIDGDKTENPVLGKLI